MFFSLVRPIRLLVNAIVAEDTPRQLAWGVALGAVIGLVPKGNLTAALLMVVLFSLRINLATGLSSATVFSLFGGMLDGLTHQIGKALLTIPSMQGTYAYLYQQPVVPWTALNNTVVLGSLILGLCLMYPIYRVSYLLFEKYQPKLAERLQRYRVGKALMGTDLATRWRIQ
ncbi:MAG: TIGR03546 family protein [Pirellulaceae bacterium]|nr:TIGR03546 family protein [Planctomycetales bacterium]